MRSLAVIAALAIAAGCRCDPKLTRVEPAQLLAEPTPLVFPATYVGEASTARLEVSNRGGEAVTAAVSIDAPFAADTSTLALVRGDARRMTVTFMPGAAQRFTSVLHIGELDVPVEGEGLAIPACTASNVCHDARFDTALAMCVETTRPDAAPCETRCIDGSCQHGVCTGAFKFCDDRNACTLDACGETEGCSHQDVLCPMPTTPCQIATCDAQAGCGTTTAPDGTLCGVDDCLATTVDVCIGGQCVTRVRPASGRCANRWVPTLIPPRNGTSLAYDAARKRVVLFGGNGSTSLGDTWEWDGVRWTEATPAQSPPGRSGAAMTWDPRRQRAVLFGGWSHLVGSTLADTWEWDGRSWTNAPTPVAPSQRDSSAMVYDSARHVALLFGGSDRVTMFADTWTWDGSVWTRLSPPRSPLARIGHTLAYDSARQRVVLFGGRDSDSNALSDTWEWDGVTWVDRQPAHSPAGRLLHTMAFDEKRRQVVVSGGLLMNGIAYDTWLWDGNDWTSAPNAAAMPHVANAMTYDAAAERVVLFGGPWVSSGISVAQTRLWDGARWALVASEASPPQRIGAPLAGTSQRLVLFGGGFGTSGSKDETWAWDSASRWTQLSPATSPPRRWLGHALAFDSSRQRLVLFGGDSADPSMRLLADTWEWDGTTWARRSPADSPGARYGHTLAFDSARQVVVLFGGNSLTGLLNDTWTFDGVTWRRATTAVAPPACFGAMAYDAARQRTVLFTGYCGGGMYVNETWEWDGAAWRKATPAVTPPTAYEFALAYDASRQRTVLAGGRAADSTALDGTWEWDGTTWTERHPVVSPAGAGVGAYLDSVHKVVFFDGTTLWFFLP